MAKRQRVGGLVVKKVGNWDSTINAIGKLGPTLKEEAKKSQRRLANSMKEAIIGHIYAQDLKWAPLRPNTLKRKQNKNRYMIYLDTETYVNAIVVLSSPKGISVGIRKGQPYKGRKDRSITVDQVAMWMEFGTSRMEARPLWQPTIEEFGGAKGLRDKIAKDIYERAKRLSKGTALNVTYSGIRRGVK